MKRFFTSSSKSPISGRYNQKVDLHFRKVSKVDLRKEIVRIDSAIEESEMENFESRRKCMDEIWLYKVGSKEGWLGLPTG